MTSENPYKKYEYLFENWPWVKAQDVRGENGMKVSGWHDTPEGRKTAHTRALIVNILWAALIGFCFHAEFHKIQHHAGLWAGGAVGVWMVLAVASCLVFDFRAMKGTAVQFSPSHIQIGEKVYDARVQHKFSMDVHRKAKEEADKELQAQQRGPGYADVRHKKYYRDAFHIYLEYLGQRILVTDISEEEKAEQFLRALVAVDRIMHKEKTVFAANANTEELAEAAAETRQADYFGKRPALD
jgi:hypothetical protein